MTACHLKTLINLCVTATTEASLTANTRSTNKMKKNPQKPRNKTATAHAARIAAVPKAEFLTDDKMTHLICNTYFFLDTAKNKKAKISDPSEVRGNITTIFKRIKTDPQILFSILMSNLIAIMRIKNLGSLLR